MTSMNLCFMRAPNESLPVITIFYIAASRQYGYLYKFAFSLFRLIRPGLTEFGLGRKPITGAWPQ